MHMLPPCGQMVVPVTPANAGLVAVVLLMAAGGVLVAAVGGGSLSEVDAMQIPKRAWRLPPSLVCRW